MLLAGFIGRLHRPKNNKMTGSLFMEIKNVDDTLFLYKIDVGWARYDVKSATFSHQRRLQILWT